MTIALCDDEHLERETLKLLLEQRCSARSIPCTIESFASGEELLAGPRGCEAPLDLIFLDIYMQGMDGIQCAKLIRKHDKTCGIVFITNSCGHAIQGFEVNALHYLVKPVTASQLDTVLDRYLQQSGSTTEPAIQRQNKQGCYRIRLADIRFVESNARILNIHTEQQGVLSFYERLDDFEQACNDARFFRCHKSFMVNLDYVHSIATRHVVLHSGELVSISTRLSEAKERFARYKADRL